MPVGELSVAGLGAESLSRSALVLSPFVVCLLSDLFVDVCDADADDADVGACDVFRTRIHQNADEAINTKTHSTAIITIGTEWE